MSVAATQPSNGSPRTVNNADLTTAGVNALGVIRQSTITGSVGDDSRQDLTNRTSHQYHYEVPNLSSMLYEYTHKEKDRVSEAFRTGNYHSLRDLPRHLLPGNVSTWSRSKIESNLFTQPEEKRYIELQNGGGYFQKFDYQESPFELFLEQSSKDRQNSDAIIEKLHGSKPFLSQPKQDHIYKHQNPFGSYLWDKNEEQKYVGFLSENDPYEANAFEVLRARWINDSKKLYGDFITS